MVVGALEHSDEHGGAVHKKDQPRVNKEVLVSHHGRRDSKVVPSDSVGLCCCANIQCFASELTMLESPWQAKPTSDGLKDTISEGNIEEFKCSFSSLLTSESDVCSDRFIVELGSVEEEDPLTQDVGIHLLFLFLHHFNESFILNGGIGCINVDSQHQLFFHQC